MVQKQLISVMVIHFKLTHVVFTTVFRVVSVLYIYRSTDPAFASCYIEEYIGLDDNKYIGDLLAEFKVAKDRSKGEILHCKLIFKKRLFRESDDAVVDPMFIQLSYVQVCSS